MTFLDYASGCFYGAEIMSENYLFYIGLVLGYVLGSIVTFFKYRRIHRPDKPEPQKAIEAEIVPEVKPEILVPPSTGKVIIEPESFKREPRVPKYNQEFRDAAAAVRGDRPELRRANVFCTKCQSLVSALSSTGMHTGGAPGGFERKSNGWIMAMAQCHGDFRDIMIPFNELEKNPGMIINVFDSEERLVAPFGTLKLYDPAKFLGVRQPKAPAAGKAKRLR